VPGKISSWGSEGEVQELAYTQPGEGSANKVYPKKADSYSFAMTCFAILCVFESPFVAVPEVSHKGKKTKAILAWTRKLPRTLEGSNWQKEALERPGIDKICRRLLAGTSSSICFCFASALLSKIRWWNVLTMRCG
jgi:hypothetical protein